MPYFNNGFLYLRLFNNIVCGGIPEIMTIETQRKRNFINGCEDEGRMEHIYGSNGWVHVKEWENNNHKESYIEETIDGLKYKIYHFNNAINIGDNNSVEQKIKSNEKNKKIIWQ